MATVQHQHAVFVQRAFQRLERTPVGVELLVHEMCIRDRSRVVSTLPPKPSERLEVMGLAPALEVMTMMVFLKFTTRPLLSVRRCV